MGDDNSIKGLGSLNAGFNMPYGSARNELLTKQISDKLAAKPAEAGKASAMKDSPAEIQKAATQFEAMLLQQMLGAMWETVPKGGLVSGSNEEGYFRDMLNEAMAKDISEKQSLGIRDVIAKDISNIENRKQKK